MAAIGTQEAMDGLEGAIQKLEAPDMQWSDPVRAARLLAIFYREDEGR